MYKRNDPVSYRRIGFGLCLLAAVFWLPWWVAIALAVGVFFLFDEYIELALVGLLIDTLHAPQQTFSFASFQYFFLCLGLFLLFSLMRRQLR